MYIDSIGIQNFRVFRKSKIDFVHPDQRFSDHTLPKPKLPNVNLLLGNNGLGKTTLLKAVALTALGPAVGDSGIYPHMLIRREPKIPLNEQPTEATIKALFTPHDQDNVSGFTRVESHVAVIRRGDLESLRWIHEDEKPWHPIFSASSDAFFFVGYGATRRVEKREQVDLGARQSSVFARAQRIKSIFEEAHSLIPLNTWLPEFEHKDLERFKQVSDLINKLMRGEKFVFTGEMEENEYIFKRQGLKVPFPALSDGYRAFLGWLGDLLYHVCMTCPIGKKLVDNKGIVMVDEIDLHLHPKWQMIILQSLSKNLPNIQFIFTSHSPLLVGSLEWMNIIVMDLQRNQASRAKRIKEAVHGLDADQVLLTDFFGLPSTRTPEKRRNIKELTFKAREGDSEAAKLLLKEMSRGMEDEG